MAVTGAHARAELLHFLSKEEEGPFTRLAKGLETLESTFTPQTQTTNYIDGTSNTTTTNYEVAWSYSGEVYSNNTANETLYDLAYHRKLGSESTVYMLNVQQWIVANEDDDPEEDDRIYQAYLQYCNFSAGSDGGGDATGNVTFSGDIQAQGDPTYGYVKITRVSGPEGNDIAVFHKTLEEFEE